MRIILAVIFIASSTCLAAQKKYDCIVFLKTISGDDSARLVGKMKWIEDSSVTIIYRKQEMIINWKNIQGISFRKHDGFMRTVLPIALLTSSLCLIDPFGGWLLAPIAFSYTMILGIPIYFISRNHEYGISNYHDFQLLQSVASKYISK